MRQLVGAEQVCANQELLQVEGWKGETKLFSFRIFDKIRVKIFVESNSYETGDLQLAWVPLSYLILI